MRYKNAVIVTGPTSVGKTEICTALARRLDGEIINSDRLYVYSFLKIGTGLSDCLSSSDAKERIAEIWMGVAQMQLEKFESISGITWIEHRSDKIDTTIEHAVKVIEQHN
ncbi:hypothetical protein HY490_01065 [Candidatus Woesearchaeota archaeon]|nr:hypothetical protein [Candidatus Woesearchaeota archaeon]